MKKIAIVFFMIGLLVSCGEKNSTPKPSLNTGESTPQGADARVLGQLRSSAGPIDTIYILKHYRFKTTEGETAFLKYLREERPNLENFRSLLWHYLSNNTSLGRPLPSTEVFKVRELVEILEGNKVNQGTINLLKYMIDGAPTFSDSKEALVFLQGEFSLLDDLVKRSKQEEKVSTLEIEVVGDYLSDLYVLAIDEKLTFSKKTEDTDALLLLDFEMFRTQFPVLTPILQKFQEAFYKKVLSEDRAFATSFAEKATVPGPIGATAWSFNFHYDNGGCYPVNKNLQFQSINDEWGMQCKYKGGDSTSARVDLSAIANSSSSPHTSSFQSEAYVLSGIRGGYADRGDENQTARISYDLVGTTEIPKCNDVFKCFPLVQVKRFKRSEITGGFKGNSESPRNSKAQVEVNGKTLLEGESVIVDRSQRSFQVVSKMSRTDKHVGACCKPADGQQKLLLGFYHVKKYEDSPGVPDSIFLTPNLDLPVLNLGGDITHPEILDALSRLLVSDSASERLYLAQVLSRNWKKEFGKLLQTGADYQMLVYGVTHLLRKIELATELQLPEETRRFLILLREGISREAVKTLQGRIINQMKETKSTLALLPLDLVETVYEELRLLVEEDRQKTREDIKREIQRIESAPYLQEKDDLKSVVLELKENQQSKDELLKVGLEALSLIRAELIKSMKQMEYKLKRLSLELAQLERPTSEN